MNQLVGTTVAVLILGSASLRAETEGEIEFGYQFVMDEFGSEQFNQYRDQGPGLLGAGHLLFSPEGGDGLYFDASFRNPTRRDQAYGVKMGRWGQFVLDLQMSQLPHIFSRSALSAYGSSTTGSDSNVTLPAGFTRTAAGLAGSLGTFAGRDRLESRQRNWSAGLDYRISETLSFRAGYELQDKQGDRPNSLQFGFFTNLVEISQPIDEKTHHANAGISWTGEGWTLDLGYEASLFRNEFDSTIVDNPIEAVDLATASSRGQLAASPENTAHRFNASWSSAIEEMGFPARVSGSLSYAIRTQEESFLPTTINSALASPALPQGDLDGDVRSLVANFQLTARPRSGVTVKARYRVHDHRNQTDAVVLAGRSEQDESIVLGAITARSLDFRRQTSSVDLRMRVAERTTLGLGYEWQNWQRDRFREVTHLNEHIGKLKLERRIGDLTRLSLRYEVGVRNGNDYDVIDPSNFAPLRTYDQADRLRQEIDLSATSSIGDRVDLTFSGGFEDSDYKDSDFGLTDEYGWHLGTDLAMQVSESVELSAYYTFERQYQRMRARRSTPADNTPGGNWKSRLDDSGHNVGVGAYFDVLPEKLTASIGYDFHFGRAEQGASGDVTGAGAFGFPSVKNNWQVFRAEFDYAVNERLSVKSGYRLERFNGDDFRVDGLGVNTTGSDVYLGDISQDYRASIIATSFVYSF